MNNPYAFPCPENACRDGMTLRDYFAAKAMQSIIISADDNPSTIDEDCEYAYSWADSMLKARES